MAAKSIIICCDGTGNEIGDDHTNVLRLYQALKKNKAQIVYYDTGVGTAAVKKAWGRRFQNAQLAFDLATGTGLDKNVLEAYRFLISNYVKGDQIYLFGFSRGAYTVRVLGGLLHHIGLLQDHQINLAGNALMAYKQSEKGQLEVGDRFVKIIGPQKIPIHFVGVWDTVSSMIVPRSDRFFMPSLQRLPYTRSNPSVEVFRHALAIDEKRRMFQVNAWKDNQVYIAPRTSPRKKIEKKPQDIKQVWFAGVHADVGGGYPEAESGQAFLSFVWMVEEVKKSGLQFDQTTIDNLCELQDGLTSKDTLPILHNSLTGWWKLIEYLPRRKQNKKWELPRGEPRKIPSKNLIHASVIERMEADQSYKPTLPKRYQVEPHLNASA